ncbi:hypothetical protein ACFLX9_03355 [Chloroflexota bacterium]
MQLSFEDRWNILVEDLHDLLGRCMEIEAKSTEIGEQQTAAQLSSIRRMVVAALRPLENLIEVPLHSLTISGGDATTRSKELTKASSRT